MGTRGRTSSASLSVVQVVPGQRPEPPGELTEEQAAIWRSVVLTKPADWFGPDTFPLLTAYCKASDVYNTISTHIDLYDSAWLSDEDGLDRYDRLAKMQDRQARLIATLATKMRLTQQSRYTPQAGSTADKKAGGAVKPWEFGKSNE